MENTNENITKKQQSSKTWIMSLPLIGWIIRFINNILHINNLAYKILYNQEQISQLTGTFDDVKQNVILLEEENNKLQQQVVLLREENNKLQQHLGIEYTLIKNDIAQIRKSDIDKSENVEKSIASQIYYQLHSLQNRIDRLES